MLIHCYGLHQNDLDELYRLEDRCAEQLTVEETVDALEGEQLVTLIIGALEIVAPLIVQLLLEWKAKPEALPEGEITNLEITASGKDGQNILLRAEKISAEDARTLLQAIR